MYDNLWRKRVFVPLWVIQLLFTGFVLVTTGIGLGIYDEHEDDISYEYGEDGDRVNTAVKAAVGVYIAISAITILFAIVEIILFARKRLSPVVAVVLNAIAFLAWVVIFILAIVALATTGVSALGFFFYLVITATCAGKLLYSSIVLHRYRKGVRARGAYTPAQAEAGRFDTTHTAYNLAAAPPNPFRDPSREPPPAPPQNQQFGGAAGEYYSTGGTHQYEMQQQNSSGERYA